MAIDSGCSLTQRSLDPVNSRHRTGPRKAQQSRHAHSAIIAAVWKDRPMHCDRRHWNAPRGTVAIAERSRRLTAVARTTASLGASARLLADRDGDRYETLDWDQPEQFVLGLQRLVNQVGHSTLVLAWLHDMNLGPRVAEVISSRERFVTSQVLGSGGGSPQGGATALRAEVEAVSDVRYFQVVLGFKRESGASCWLTDDEDFRWCARSDQKAGGSAHRWHAGTLGRKDAMTFARTVFAMSSELA